METAAVIMEAATTATVTATTATVKEVIPAASVQETSSRPVLPCVQGSQPGCSGPAWLAVLRDVLQ